MLRHGVLIAAGVGLITIVAWLCLRPFLWIFGQPPEVVTAARVYLLLFASSLAPALVAHACKQFCEALNRAWIPNGILLGGVLLNILLNWIFIFSG